MLLRGGKISSDADIQTSVGRVGDGSCPPILLCVQTWTWTWTRFGRVDRRWELPHPAAALCKHVLTLWWCIQALKNTKTGMKHLRGGNGMIQLILGNTKELSIWNGWCLVTFLHSTSEIVSTIPPHLFP